MTCTDHPAYLQPPRFNLKISTIFFLLLLLFTGSLCQATQEKYEVRLQLSWFHPFQFAGYYAAQEQGYYSDAGLEVRIVEGDPNRNTITEVVDGRAHYGVSNTEFLLHPSQDNPLVLLPLQEGGTSPSGDAINTEIPATTAHTTSQPSSFQKEKIHASFIRPSGYGIELYGDCLFTTNHHLKAHPEQVAAFRQASIRGWEYAKNHPQKTVELINSNYASNTGRDHLRFDAGATRELGHPNPGKWYQVAKTFAQFNLVEPDHSLKGIFSTPGFQNSNLMQIIILLLAGSILVALSAAATLFVLNKKLQREVIERKQVQQALQESEKQLLNYSKQMEQLSLSAASMIALTDEKEIFAKISAVIVQYSDYRRVLISLLTEEHPFREIIGVGGLSEEMVIKLRKNSLPRAWYERVFSDGEHIGRLCSYVPHTQKDLLYDSTTLFGAGPVPDSPDAWHPEDNLYVKMVDEKGRFIGVISVDESKSGRRPTDDTVRPLEIFASLISQIIILKREHTRRRKLEIQLRQAHKMEAVGNLTSGIAHDFNNILSVIIGSLDLLQRKPPEEDSIVRQLDNIKSASHRARDIVQQLLTFSRKQEGLYRQVDIIPIIEEALVFLNSTIPSSIQVQSRITLSDAVILGDPTQVHQVLTNLLTNAAHAMEDKGGTLHLNATREEVSLSAPDGADNLQPGAYVKITVRDTGIGIPPETVHRIFDPYFTTKDFGKGTGLGLAISHGIVQSHRGSISVQTSHGKGSTFTIHLPLISEHQTPKIER